MSKSTLKIRDLTLRDGQQSLFATRMTQDQVVMSSTYESMFRFVAGMADVLR